MSPARPPRIGPAQRRARLGRRHLLAPSRRAATVEEAVEAVVGLHATDAATVYVSACARLAAPDAAAVDRALYEDVSLVKLLSMRRTLFAVTTGLAPVVNSSTARAIAAKERATLLKHLTDWARGWDEERLAATERAVLAALTARGEATTAELARDVPALREQIEYGAGTSYAARQSVGSRLLRLLASDGHIRRCRPRGSWTSSLYPWAPVPPLPELPVREAKAELARRWLAAYGPATEADLKWWTGWTLTDARRALADLGAEPVELDEGPGFTVPGDTAELPEPEPWAALLPGLDPTAMGWRGRDWYLDPEHVPALFDRNGNIGPTVWWNGRIVGGWAQRPDGEPVWRLLVDTGREAEHAVAAEAERLAGWLGETRITPRFRTPLERELSG
ncbi:winged helix DNA-binding domain-containing protein [Streptomyces sp. LX-29]|uniref:winged helix DNA-binding domain-containing protein n=1 Tax=Streptomyces sp. LX-29 TaxID=2900152 RepID=UPI00240DC98D|nr:winged helix DNA-binding domain-containing protein [Streptomyces sp. LX-29]WFB08908.1 winged helix DNA-binding domain-containing protein [Streptomyces sp. LX-29]